MFKIGDKVRIKPLSIGEKYNEVSVNQSMVDLSGKVSYIDGISIFNGIRYTVLNNNFMWTEDMLEKPKSRFKAGEKVKIKQLELGAYYNGVRANADMVSMSGGVKEIECALYGGTCYTLKDTKWGWTEDMLERVEEKQKLEVGYAHESYDKICDIAFDVCYSLRKINQDTYTNTEQEYKNMVLPQILSEFNKLKGLMNYTEYNIYQEEMIKKSLLEIIKYASTELANRE